MNVDLAKLATWGTAALVALAMGLVVLASLALGAGRTPSADIGAIPSTVPDVPAGMLAIYAAAGQRYGIDWSVLAAIGKVESDHDRSNLPGVHSGTNFVGCCAGPMQISITGGAGSTWGRYRVDGDHDGRYDVYDPADAVYTAANYLKACGAPASYPRAVFTYNHSQAYVDEVLQLAARYRASSFVAGTSGTRAQTAIRVALSFLGTPYRWGGNSPRTGFDCSGLVQWSYAQAGVTLPRTTYQQWTAGPHVAPADLQPGDIVFFDARGHEGLYLGADRYVEAPHTGDVVKIAMLHTTDPTYSGAVRPT
jgi:cell wall-associated NlpC family hydrolase